MQTTTALDNSLLQQWLIERAEVSSIEENLRTKGFDPELVTGYVKEYKRIRYARRLYKGFLFLGAGAFIGFVSCILSLTNPIPSLYNFFLYGFISIAMALIFIGLYLVFEG